jgi:hypothetical protein
MRENTERWMELARLAATKQGPQKLVELVREVNHFAEAEARAAFEFARETFGIRLRPQSFRSPSAVGVRICAR